MNVFAKNTLAKSSESLNHFVRCKRTYFLNRFYNELQPQGSKKA